MSYDLYFEFQPALEAEQFLGYFRRRKYYEIADEKISYEHPQTGVYFWIHYKTGRSLFLKKIVRRAHFEINYNRPSYFGLEAEIELAALVVEFNPGIDDQQIQGMGDGPYSAEKFLAAWNYGNVFMLQTILSRYPNEKLRTLPQDRLQAAWRWNYRNKGLIAEVNDRQFVPRIFTMEFEGRPVFVATWPPTGMPIRMPKVDYVLVGLPGRGKRFALATLDEVQDIAGQAGFETVHDILEIKYSKTPQLIIDWLETRQPIDLRNTIYKLEQNQFVDAEVVEAARKEVLRGTVEISQV